MDVYNFPLVNVHITDGKITMLLMGKLTISMAIFNSYVSLPEGSSRISRVSKCPIISG